MTTTAAVVLPVVVGLLSFQRPDISLHHTTHRMWTEDMLGRRPIVRRKCGSAVKQD